MEFEKYRQVIKDAIQGEIDARHFYAQVSDRIKDLDSTVFTRK